METETKKKTVRKEDGEESASVDLRSEEFQEVLGAVPPWILRWGIVTVASVVVLLIAGSALFRYPDVVTATATLTGSRPAATVVAHSTGKLQRVYVEDNQPVKAGDYLALIENEARAEDVRYLRDFLERQAAVEADSLRLPRRDLTLGTMQSLYASYYTALAAYRQFMRLDYYRRKAGMMEGRIRQTEDYARHMERQRALTEEQLAVSRRQYQRDSLLHAQRLLSDAELETTYNAYLQARLAYENTVSGMESQRIQIAQLRETLYDTEYQHEEQKGEQERQLQSLAMQLRTGIRDWELAYVLKAPVDGKVTFTNFWVENQNLTAGEEAFNVVPEDNGRPLAKAMLPTDGSGKVKVGQRVHIRFNNFPDTEFGVVEGTVGNISLVSVKVEDVSNYVVEISLPDGLRTTYGKELPFVPGMEGQADIVTENRSLLERFLLPVKKVWTEHVAGYTKE